MESSNNMKQARPNIIMNFIIDQVLYEKEHCTNNGFSQLLQTMGKEIENLQTQYSTQTQNIDRENKPTNEDMIKILNRAMCHSLSKKLILLAIVNCIKNYCIFLLTMRVAFNLRKNRIVTIRQKHKHLIFQLQLKA